MIIKKNQGTAANNNDLFGTGLAVVETPTDSVLLAIGAPSTHGYAVKGQVFVIERASNDWGGRTVLDETMLGVDGADTGGLVAFFEDPRDETATWDQPLTNYGGAGLAFSGDSRTLFIGAANSEEMVVPLTGRATYDRGAVYVYEDWKEAMDGDDFDIILSAFDDVSNMRLGQSIGVSSDGRTVVVNGNGCMTNHCQRVRHANEGNSSSEEQVWPGAAYVFERPALGWGTWMRGDEVVLHPHGGVPGDIFGQSVAISADGSKIAAGFANRLDGGVGAAYVFTEPSAGWGRADGSKVGRYEVTNKEITSEYAGFGRVLAMSGDGTQVVVGRAGNVVGYHGGDNPESIAGAVYLYPRTGMNRAPVLVKELDSLTVSLDTAPDAIDLMDHFEDPDNDVLYFSATSSDDRLLKVSVEDERGGHADVDSVG